ncbi:MAG: VCBS repeat-containing protein [Isosphaeraceae bacterium]
MPDLAEPIELLSWPPSEGQGGPYPAIGDLDGDDVPDLIVGNSSGRMLCYRNAGTRETPEFEKPFCFDEICPGGRIPTGSGGADFRPQFVDVDGDGRLDLLTGSGNPSDRMPGFYWFRRESDGRFSAQPKVRVRVQGEGQPIRLGTTLLDWDGDGKLDVVSAPYGLVPIASLYVSSGPWSLDGEVATSLELKAGPGSGTFLACLVDWNREGHLIAFAAYQRVARRLDLECYPHLGNPRALVKVAGDQLLSFPESDHPTGFSTGDWDGDGFPDLVVGLWRTSESPTGTVGIQSGVIQIYKRRPGGTARLTSAGRAG